MNERLNTKALGFIFGGVIVLLLLVLGYQSRIIHSQGYEITTLRATCIADKSDLDSLRKTLSDLSLEREMIVLRTKKAEKVLAQYTKMVEEEKDLFGDSIMGINHILDENDEFIDYLLIQGYGAYFHDLDYTSYNGLFKTSNKTVIYSDSWIISYKLDYDTDWGHGTTRTEVGTLNRNSHPWYYQDVETRTAGNSNYLTCRLKLSDIVSKDDIPRMTALLIDPFKKELDKKGLKYEIKEDGSLYTGHPLPRPTENFYYADDGLHFVYNMYEIHCGAAGSFDLCIEWPLPESVVYGHRYFATNELPEEWPIPAKIAPRPIKKVSELLPENVRFERIMDECGYDIILNIYSGDHLSFSHEANHEHVGFMKYNGNDGEDSFKTVFCSFDEPFDYHDYLLDMKGDGDYRYLILGDLSNGTAATMEGYLIDAKDDFAIVGRIPVREFISYPKNNPDLIFDFFERIDYMGALDGGYIHIKMRIQKGKEPQYVETEKRPFSIKVFEKELLDTKIVKRLSTKDDTGFNFDDPIPWYKEVAFHKLCGELFSNGELDKLHDYAKQMGFSETEISEWESECMKLIHTLELYEYVHKKFKSVW